MPYRMLFVFVLSFFALQLTAQNDTLLFRDFQEPIANELLFPDVDSIGTNNWINWDRDGKAQANDSVPKRFFGGFDLRYQETDLMLLQDTNFVYLSNSNLRNSLPGSHNWLITPPVIIPPGGRNYVLEWKSGASQGPRYMDGYKVMIARNTFERRLFTDTIFVHAEMLEPIPVSGFTMRCPDIELDSFNFSPGYIHADGYTNDSFYICNEQPDPSIYRPILEPHTYNLQDYIGDTIYIAFLHDSNNDNFLELDDIMVYGERPTSTQDLADRIGFKLFPNPVADVLQFSVETPGSLSDVVLQVINSVGKILINKKI
ncbi:MAG: hypothetical protein AAF990_20455, partial [Bacteroidota bacterium]